MNYKTLVLPLFLKGVNNNVNVLEGFNMNSIIEKYKNENIYICPICLNKCNRKTRTNGCNHIYCNDCITKWMKISNKCPMCRRNFSRIIKVN